MVNSKTDYDVEIIGPVRPDPSWQFKAGQGFDATNFIVDWDNKVVTCPQGHKSTKWIPRSDVKGQAIIDIRFLGSTCRACPVRLKCTQSKTQPRELSLSTQLEPQPSITRKNSEVFTPIQPENELQPSITRESEFHQTSNTAIAKNAPQPIAKQSVGLPVASLEILRDRVLSEMKLGKQAPGYKTAQKALNRFISELIGSV